MDLWDVGKKLQQDLIEDVLEHYPGGTDAANVLFGSFAQAMLALSIEMERTHENFNEEALEAMIAHARDQIKNFRDTAGELMEEDDERDNTNDDK